jgi:hypothetical protein
MYCESGSVIQGDASNVGEVRLMRTSSATMTQLGGGVYGWLSSEECMLAGMFCNRVVEEFRGVEHIG